jgi:hypothetical protein
MKSHSVIELMKMYYTNTDESHYSAIRKHFDDISVRVTPAQIEGVATEHSDVESFIDALTALGNDY